MTQGFVHPVGMMLTAAAAPCRLQCVEHNTLDQDIKSLFGGWSDIYEKWKNSGKVIFEMIIRVDDR